VVHRQVLLHKRNTSDPITTKPPVVLHQPTTGVYLMPSQKLVELLRELPEAPWKCYGRDKRCLDDEVLYALLRPYKLASVKLKVAGATHRGLTYQSFCERYERFRRTGDPSLDSVKEELDRDFGPPGLLVVRGPGTTSPSSSPSTPFWDLVRRVRIRPLPRLKRQ
jgi:hypothetical protein